MSRSSIALFNHRAAIILIVLALLSVLPYFASLPPTPYPFNSPLHLWVVFPILASGRNRVRHHACRELAIAAAMGGLLRLSRLMRPCAEHTRA